MSRITAAACAALIAIAPFGSATAHAADAADTTSTTVVSTDSTYVYDLENEPSACLNSNPRPNCGKKPQQSGDRGGAMQYTVFAVMILGLGVIGTVVIRNVVKRDRAIAEEIGRGQQ